MSTINSIASTLAHTATATAQNASGSGQDFGSVLKSTVQGVDGYQRQATQAISDFLQGNGELHNVAMATQRAEMAFDFAVQVRNKVVSAYQEIMKMPL